MKSTIINKCWEWWATILSNFTTYIENDTFTCVGIWICVYEYI